MLLLLSLITLTSCVAPAETGVECLQQSWVDSLPNTFQLPYNMLEPDAAFELDNDLEEISGLSLSHNERYLLAVNDEEGKLFYLDLNSGHIKQQINFWKDGDYEGVETVGKDVYVLKSTGTLYHIQNPGAVSQKVEKYNTVLTDDNDVEGLAWDKANNRLLLACKAKAGVESGQPLQKAIFSFDLQTKKVDKTPFLCISLEDVHAYLKTDPNIRKLEKVVEFFDPNESEFGFSPSGIAIHPQTGHLYITSSVGKLLMVVTQQGQILHIEKLKKSIHAQPEGICFAPDGTLYIANEGKGGDPMVYRFGMK